jgi:hypothetical protein
VARLVPALPAGMVVTQVVQAPLNAPALQADLRWAEYVATVETQETPTQVEARLQTLLAATTVMRERRGKVYDLRPLVLSLSVEPAEDVSVRVAMRLMADASAGTGRPDEVLAALGWSDMHAHLHRRALGFAGS